MSFRMTQPVFTFDKLLQRLQLGKKAPPPLSFGMRKIYSAHTTAL